jgi:hypothetical protein
MDHNHPDTIGVVGEDGETYYTSEIRRMPSPPPTDRDTQTEASTAPPTAPEQTRDDTTRAVTADDWEPPLAVPIVIPGGLSTREKRGLRNILHTRLFDDGYASCPGGERKEPPEGANPAAGWAPWCLLEALQYWAYPVELANGTILFYRFLERKWICVGVYRPE